MPKKIVHTLCYFALGVSYNLDINDLHTSNIYLMHKEILYWQSVLKRIFGDY
jgi:hypothetical protein